MNLRTIESDEPKIKKYWYFFNYSFQTDSGSIGEGMTCLSYNRRPITDMAQIREICEHIVNDHNNSTPDEKPWKSVIIRNFILLRAQGEEDGIESGETKASAEDDPEVPEGS